MDLVGHGEASYKCGDMGHKVRASPRGANKKNETTPVGQLQRHNPNNQQEGGMNRDTRQEGADADPSQELLDEVGQTIERGKSSRAKWLAASLPPVSDEELASQLVEAIIGRWTDAKRGRQALHQEVLMFVEETAGDIVAEAGGLRFRLVHQSAWFCMELEDPSFEARAKGPTDDDLLVEAPRTAGISAGRWCILRGR